MAFTYYKQGTVDKTQCGSSGALANFALLEYETDAKLATVSNGGYTTSVNGYDIRPYADSGLTTPLQYELVSYSPITGAIQMWINCGTGGSQISSSTSAVIYLATGNSSLTTDGSSSATWNSNWQMVQHLENTSCTDSTSNGNNGTNNGGTNGTGNIGGGIALSGSPNRVAEPINITTVGQPFAVSGWINPTGTSGYRAFWGGATTTGSLEIRVNDSTNNIQVLREGVAGVITTSGTVTGSAWSKVVLTIDGSNNVKVYINGASPETATLSGSFTSDTSLLGGWDFNGLSTEDPFIGTIDEVRVANSVFNDSWWLAEYNSQKSGSTFISWGSWTPVGGSFVGDEDAGITFPVTTYW
jgi:hypothetical protein